MTRQQKHPRHHQRRLVVSYRSRHRAIRATIPRKLSVTLNEGKRRESSEVVVCMYLVPHVLRLYAILGLHVSRLKHG